MWDIEMNVLCSRKLTSYADALLFVRMYDLKY